MKVLQINKKYLPWVGGVEKVVRDICVSLKDKIEIKALVASDTRQKKVERYEDICVTRLPMLFTLGNTPISLSLISELKKLKANIYHFHHPYPWGDISYLIAKPKGKVIVTYHSDIVKQKFLLKVYEPFMMRFLSQADKIVATSPRMIEYSPILQKFKDKCIAIPLGIESEKFDTINVDPVKVADLRQRYGPNIVLFVGRLIYYKGIEYLIEAIRKVNANLVIIGSGPLKEQLVKQARTIGVKNRIFFIDKLSDEELPEYYHACDVFTLPSIERTEAFGIVQLEAMASGKPVISTNLTTGVPFVNKDSETGFVVKPKSPVELSKAINCLLENDKLRYKFGETGKARVKKEFTVKLMTERYLELYKSLV